MILRFGKTTCINSVNDCLNSFGKTCRALRIGHTPTLACRKLKQNYEVPRSRISKNTSQSFPERANHSLRHTLFAGNESIIISTRDYERVKGLL